MIFFGSIIYAIPCRSKRTWRNNRMRFHPSILNCSRCPKYGMTTGLMWAFCPRQATFRAWKTNKLKKKGERDREKENLKKKGINVCLLGTSWHSSFNSRFLPHLFLFRRVFKFAGIGREWSDISLSISLSTTRHRWSSRNLLIFHHHGLCEFAQHHQKNPPQQRPRAFFNCAIQKHLHTCWQARHPDQRCHLLLLASVPAELISSGKHDRLELDSR